MTKLKLMPKGRLSAWVTQLLDREFRVVGPKPLHNQYIFGDITDPDELVVDYPTTILPPKKYLLPQREELFGFNTRTLDLDGHFEARPTVILGIHTCDMHAIQLLDKVHATGYADQHYQARRQQTYLVSFECFKPCMEHSFCKSMDTVTAPQNFDLHFTDMGDVYAVEVGSNKGETLLEGCLSVWESTPEDYERLNAVMAAKWPLFDYRLDVDVTDLPDLMARGHDSPLWDELGERCLACGMCTQVCPTCYCFDVFDETDLSRVTGTRVRAWDSCQIEKFAVVAGGHNFRTARAMRQRHRFMRKAQYQFESYGLMGCVGCGRCAAACLVNITPINTINELNQRHPKPATEPAEELNL